MGQRIVSREEWLEARRALLAEEKALSKERDALNAKRRAMPWVRVEADYVFEGTEGKEDLPALFAGRPQLIVQHFMYGADWEAGCPSCSFWADNVNGTVTHLAARAITFVAISTAPLAKLEAYKKRMGWTFKWLSAAGTTFNQDFGVTFTPAQLASDAPNYNYGSQKFEGPEAPGVSAFYQDEEGAVFHTYSTYARGLDMLNGAYHYMDIAPLGRNEEALPWSMAWLRRQDEY